MKKTLLYTTLFTLIAVLSIQCRRAEPIETGAIELTFSINYDGEDISLFTDEKEYLDYSILFTRFATYLSQVQLLEDSDNLDLFDNELIHFTSGAEGNTSITIDKIPVGTYNGLELGLGLDAVANATNPQDHIVGSPLGNLEFYWDAWESYIFTKIEGKVLHDGEYSSFAYHTGADESYRIARVNHPIEIEANRVKEVEFMIDLKKIFKKEDSYYDLTRLQNLHNQGDIQDMNRIADNLVQAISVRF